MLETSDDFGVPTGHAELDGPIPLTLFGRQTRWITHRISLIGATCLSEAHTDPLGFDDFST
ncbi:MAG: hypothetical protein HWD60_09225 [Defluviicoccus sp.]|nr:MAG: hypothetical protein HWD60_09225 [Defluviicoccus sp.]